MMKIFKKCNGVKVDGRDSASVLNTKEGNAVCSFVIMEWLYPSESK